jgi:hypothetical protein
VHARQAPTLDERRSHHHHDRQEQAGAEALQLRQAPLVAGEPPGGGDEHPVVHGHPDYDADGIKRRQGRRRDGEHADLLVHHPALLQERPGELREDSKEHDAGGPDREHPNDQLQLFHLCDGA